MLFLQDSNIRSSLEYDVEFVLQLLRPFFGRAKRPIATNALQSTRPSSLYHLELAFYHINLCLKSSLALRDKGALLTHKAGRFDRLREDEGRITTRQVGHLIRSGSCSFDMGGVVRGCVRDRGEGKNDFGGCHPWDDGLSTVLIPGGWGRDASQSLRHPDDWIGIC